MHWRKLVGAVFVGAPLICGGCAREKPLLARQLTVGDLDVQSDPLPTVVAQASRTGPIVARSQKGDEPLPEQPIRPVSRVTSQPGLAADVTGSAILARVHATVNGVAILDEEIEAMAYQALVAARRLPEPGRTKEVNQIKQKALDQLIERELIITEVENRLGPKQAPKIVAKLEEAARKEFERQWVQTMIKANGVRDEAQLKQMLLEQGLPLETVRRQWVRNFMSMEFMRQIIGPTLERIGHDQMLDYYRSHPEDFEVKDSVEWQDLFISVQRHGSKEAARRMAEQVLLRARSGEDFVVLCKQFDDGDSVLREGMGIGRERGEIKPAEAEPVLFQMRAGDLGPLVELPHGYHVIKLVKRDYAGRKPFNDEVQREIKAKLKNEVAEQERKRVLSKMKRKAVIEYAGGRP